MMSFSENVHLQQFTMQPATCKGRNCRIEARTRPFYGFLISPVYMDYLSAMFKLLIVAPCGFCLESVSQTLLLKGYVTSLGK